MSAESFNAITSSDETRGAGGQDAKVVLITRKTRLEELVAQYNTEDQAAFVIESRGGDFNEYRLEHDTYLQALDAVVAHTKTAARVQLLEREFLTNFLFGPNDIIVVLGQDGLVANSLKYLDGQPVIAINPDPKRIDGVLLPFSVHDVPNVLSDVIKSHYASKQITMAQAVLNDGQELTGVNDIFIGPRYQTSARYSLAVDGQEEMQSSSGIIVSTGLGSTGWLKSIVAGAAGIAGADVASNAMEWNAQKLRFAVREPFPSQTTGTSLVFGEIASTTRITVKSMMAGNGVIFSDGMVDDFIEFNSGAITSLSISPKTGQLVC